MADQVKTEVAVLGVEAGGRRLTEVNTVSIAGPRTRNRNRGHYYALAEPDLWDNHGIMACHIVLDALDAALAHEQSLSLTSTLMRAFAAAHEALEQENRRNKPKDRRLVGLSVAAMRNDELYLVQAGPALAYVVHRGQLRRIVTPVWQQWSAMRMGEPVPEDAHRTAMSIMMAGNALGQVAVRRAPEPVMHHVSLEHGDMALLANTTLGRVAADASLEDVLAGQDSLPFALEEIERVYLTGGAPEDLTVVAISIIDEGVLSRPRGAVPDDSYEPVPRPVETGPRPIPFQIARPTRAPDEGLGYYEPTYEADPGYRSRHNRRERMPPVTLNIEQATATGTGDDLQIPPHTMPPGSLKSNTHSASNKTDARNYRNEQEDNSGATLEEIGHATVFNSTGGTRVRPTHTIQDHEYDDAEYDDDWDDDLAPAIEAPSMTKRVSDIIASVVAFVNPGHPDTDVYDIRQEDFRRPRYAGNLPENYFEEEQVYDRIGRGARRNQQRMPVMLVGAVVILALVFGTILAVRLIQNRDFAQSPAAMLEEARSIESQGMGSQDSKTRRENLNRALDLASRSAQGGNTEARDLIIRIQGELDVVNGVTRIAAPVLLRDLTSLGTTSELSDIVVNQNNLYVLDSTNGFVLKYLINADGSLSKEDTILFRNGDNLPPNLAGLPAEGKIAQLKALFWMPAAQSGGSLKQSFLLAMDSQGHLIGYDPTRGLFTIQLPPHEAETRAPGAAEIAGFNGQLYLLDKRLKITAYREATGSISWASFTTSNGIAGFNDWALYFAPEVRANITMEDVSDFAVDGTLYLLHASGKIERFFGGTQQKPFDSDVPDTPLKNPVQIFTDDATQAVYVLDPANGRVVQYSKEKSDYVRQFRSAGDTVLRSAQSMYIDESKGRAYIISGHQIFSFAIPK